MCVPARTREIKSEPLAPAAARGDRAELNGFGRGRRGRAVCLGSDVSKSLGERRLFRCGVS